ncbi:MAG: helix-turn-helix domain-containing protein [Pseudomonadota bacterium]
MKWKEVLPSLRTARAALDLNKGRLDLLEALFACVPGDRLYVDRAGELVVHASNKRLAEMTNRDSEKTITRLLSELEARDLIRRKYSPNGKRYARQGRDNLKIAYGVDLSPLLSRMKNIQSLALAAEEEAEACQRLREDISLWIKDLVGRTDFVALLDEARKLLRRKPCLNALTLFTKKLANVTASLCATAPQNTCHKEPRENPIKEKQVLPKVSTLAKQFNGNIREMSHYIRLSLDINEQLWKRTISTFGFGEAVLLIMTIFERGPSIRSPSAYLGHLIARNIDQPGQMLLKQLEKRQARHRESLPTPIGQACRSNRSFHQVSS